MNKRNERNSQRGEEWSDFLGGLDAETVLLVHTEQVTDLLILVLLRVLDSYLYTDNRIKPHL